MNSFWNENGTKILGALTAVLGTLASLIAAGAFKELLTPTAIGWLNIFVSLSTAGVGGATMARGFNNSAQVKIASAMETAIKAQPGQGGFARPLMLALLLAVAIPAVTLLHGCASLGVPTPQTFNERVAAGYVSVTTTRQTATILLNGQVITSADATNIQKQADVAREGLDVARTLQGIDAEKKLDATLLILDTAQSYLCAKAPANPNCQR